MMKIIVRKIIFFGILLLTFAVVQMWLGNLFPLSKPDLSWGLTVKYHFIVYCGIIGVYSLLFPMSIAFYSALIFQTVSFWIFFSSSHPLRSVEMNLIAYLCIIVPYILRNTQILTNSFHASRKETEKNGEGES